MWQYIGKHYQELLTASIFALIISMLNYFFNRRKWKAECNPEMIVLKSYLFCFIHEAIFTLKQYNVDQVYWAIYFPFIREYTKKKRYIYGLYNKYVFRKSLKYLKQHYLYYKNFDHNNPQKNLAYEKLKSIHDTLAVDLGI